LDNIAEGLLYEEVQATESRKELELLAKAEKGQAERDAMAYQILVLSGVV
jgi:hypothetical protein